jgi:hypothetical protein
MLVQADVDEALRLMRMSKVSLLDNAGQAQNQRDPVSMVYEALRDDALRTRKQTYTWEDLMVLLGHKFTVRAFKRLFVSKAAAHLPKLPAVPLQCIAEDTEAMRRTLCPAIVIACCTVVPLRPKTWPTKILRCRH